MKRIILTRKTKVQRGFKIQKHKNLSLQKHSLFIQYLICFITVRKNGKKKRTATSLFSAQERRPNAFQET